MRHVMIDLETLGTKPGCMVVSIGACVFGPDGIGPTFHKKIDIRTSPLAIDPTTVLWWVKQSDEAREEFNGTESHESVMKAFDRWFGPAGDTSVWAGPAHFDIPILEAAMGYKHPWTHRDVRDLKTVCAIANAWPDRTKGVVHNALNDAIVQAEAAIVALNKIGWPVE